MDHHNVIIVVVVHIFWWYITNSFLIELSPSTRGNNAWNGNLANSPEIEKTWTFKENLQLPL